jgi:hypothetical protein
MRPLAPAGASSRQRRRSQARVSATISGRRASHGAELGAPRAKRTRCVRTRKSKGKPPTESWSKTIVNPSSRRAAIQAFTSSSTRPAA